MADSSEEFDASVGLAFSLKAFEVYYKSGMLSAEVRSVPGIRGRCMACLEIVLGKVVTSYVIDKAGIRHALHQNILLQLDSEKGPFSWIFHASPLISASTPEPAQPPLARSQPRSPVPQPQVRYLDQHQLQKWPGRQQQ